MGQEKRSECFKRFPCDSGVIVSYACWCLVCLSPALLTLPALVKMLFKGGWQQNGLNGVCWRNTYQICGHAIVRLRHLQGLWLLLRLWIYHAFACSPLLLAIQMWRKEREGERREGEKGKELLITCFVWSESPCKYMNSKCRKSNLVAHWYILLFAYLPAPVVSSCVSGLGTSNTQRYAYIFPPPFL